MAKRVLILGVNGQVGGLLAEHLVLKDCEVHGLVRRSSTGNLRNIQHLLPHIKLHHGDLCDPQSVDRVIRNGRFTHILNEADQDNVDWSFATPAYSIDVTAGAVLRLLESVRQFNPSIRVFQPVSATMFGDRPPPQDEETPINPMSPYAVCKAAAFSVCRMYRQCYGMHVSTGIMFNHTSTRRHGDYLLHKICRAAVTIAEGRQESLAIGDPDMRVDIGCAKEYAEASWLIAEHSHPDDFVVGTGCAWTVREMIEEAFKVAGIEDDLESLLVRDEAFKRPGTQPRLIADAGKIKRVLGWKAKRGVADIVREFIVAARENKL